jgi:hypothetical protein
MKTFSEFLTEIVTVPGVVQTNYQDFIAYDGKNGRASVSATWDRRGRATYSVHWRGGVKRRTNDPEVAHQLANRLAAGLED